MDKRRSHGSQEALLEGSEKLEPSGELSKEVIDFDNMEYQPSSRETNIWEDP